MIDTYRLNPTEYLTATACRRNLAGDVCAVIRVHAFLEQWGLINYHVDHESRPSVMGPPSTSHFMVIADTDEGLVPLNNETGIGLTASEKVVKVTEASKLPSPFALHSDVYRPSETAAPDVENWTDAETLSLLEGIELFKEDWFKIAEHVNHANHGDNDVRSHDDCIMAFLSLPIEDPYLDPAAAHAAAPGEEPGPFHTTPNALMSTLAFLASSVAPSIAGVGAKAAMEELGKDCGAAAEDGEADDAGEAVPSEDRLRAATSAVLDAAGSKARLLVRAEERKLMGLVAKLVETQLQKLEIKLKQFEELDVIMEKERAEFEAQRLALIRERNAAASQ